MNCSYDEIVKALGRPGWWNEYAAPRYVPFAPRHVGNIYADDCALVLIACQSCGDSFRVCFSDNDMHRFLSRHAASLRDEITGGVIHYGDPPNIHCCPSGPTMNCEDLEVLEFWTRRNDPGEWVDDPVDQPIGRAVCWVERREGDTPYEVVEHVLADVRHLGYDITGVVLEAKPILMRVETDVEARIAGREDENCYIECTKRAKHPEPFWRMEIVSRTNTSQPAAVTSEGTSKAKAD